MDTLQINPSEGVSNHTSETSRNNNNTSCKMTRQQKRKKERELNKRKPIGTKNRMVDFTSINTPTTVEEFRDNLLKYYFSHGRKLYVNELGFVNVDEINSMEDISNTMWEKYGEEQFEITPLVIQTGSWDSFSEKNVEDYLSKGIRYVCMKWWLNPNNNIIYERNLRTEIDPMKGFLGLTQKYGDGKLYWRPYNEFGGVGDNYIEFYVKTLGEFGVYPTEPVFEEEQNQLVETLKV